MQVAIMLYAGFRLLEVTGPMDVFHEANRLCGETLYEQHLVGPSADPVLCSSGVAVSTTAGWLDAPTAFDTVVVPGSPVLETGHEQRELVHWLGDVGRRVRRLASVSNGARLLARAGLAEHRALVTHWRDAQRLAAEFPRVQVMGNRGYVRDGNLYPAGGVSDGIGVALALVAEDFGEAFARRVITSLSSQA